MAGVVIYSDNNDIASELVGFAKGAGKDAFALTFDEKTAQAMSNSGADKVFLLQGDSELVESYGKAIAEILKKEEAELFAVGATARGRDIAARVAGYLDCGMVSDASFVGFVDGGLTTERILYGGAVLQGEILEGLSVATIPAGKYAPISGTSTVIRVEVQADKRVSLMETAAIVKQGTNIAVAEKIVCVGLAMEKEEDLQMAKDLAAAIGAEIGCTRGVAEKRHWLPVEQYIGISGAVVRPKLYIAMGVSGQIHHIYGIRDAQIIVAVNINEKAPIFRVADYSIVGDMYEVIPLLTETLEK